MTDEHVDQRDWALLKELWETPVGRRWVLKAGLGSAVALGAEMYAGPAVAAAKRLGAGVAPAEFHFQLGSLRGVSDLVLVANGIRTPLSSHTRMTHAELRRSSRLWRAADLSTLTHYVSGLELPNERAVLMSVLGRRGSQTVVVAQKWHVSAEARSRLAMTTYRLTGSMAAVAGSPQRLNALGISAGQLRRPEHVVAVSRVVGVSDSAFGLVSVHPNIATVVPAQHIVTENLITPTPELRSLAKTIGSIQDNGGDYATLETGVHADGKTPYEITIPANPKDPGSKPRTTTFETFKLDKDHPELHRNLKTAVRVGITKVRDDERLGAVVKNALENEPQRSETEDSRRTWIQPEGVVPEVRKHSTALLKDNKIDVKVKNTGLNSGTYVVAKELENGKVPLRIYNNYVRWVSVYVQYLGKDGKNLSLNPDAQAPDTPHAKSLGLLPQVFTVLGIPIWDTNTIDVELEFPKGSHVARLLMCGLGADVVGDGWRQYFPKDAYTDSVSPVGEVILPALITGLLTIGMNVFALATDIDVAITWASIRRDIAEESFELIPEGARTLSKIPQISQFIKDGAGALSLGSKEALGLATAIGAIDATSLNQAAGGSLSNLWNILLGLGSVLPKFLFSPAAGKLWIKIATALAGELAAEKLVESIPLVGQVLAVIAAVGDAVTLAEVCAETIVSPWVIENEVSLTYDARIEIKPDQRLASPAFPATARSWRLEALVEGSLSLDPVTGSINGGEPGPLSVKVAAPFGGKDIQWSVVFLDGSGRQVGTGVSKKLPNDDPEHPAKEVSFAITQLPATITGETIFARRLTTTYDTAAGSYEWFDRIAVTGTQANKGVQDVTGTAVATLAGVAGMVFKQNDRFYIRGVPLATTAGARIELGTARHEGFARRPFLLLDPFVESNDLKNHILLEPDPQTDAYHVRRLSLNPKTGEIAWDPNLRLGTFALPVSAAALHASGKVVVINTNHGRIGVLQPIDTPRPQLATYLAGPGTRVGLLKDPIAVAITNPGVVLVLEGGTHQIAAFDLNGNPVRYFKVKAGSEREFRQPLASAGTALDMAVDGGNQIYVLYRTGAGTAVEDYRIDIYDKDGQVFNQASISTNIPRLAIDYWRSIYGANYDALTDLGTPTPRIDPRLGVAEPSLSRFDPTG